MFRHPSNRAALAVLATTTILSGPLAAQAQTLTLRTGSDFDTLDPAQVRISDGYQMITGLYDRLVALDAQGAPVSHLAERWETDGLSTVFHLQSGVTCSDGTPLAATSVAASLNRLADPETNAPYRVRTFGEPVATAVADDAAGTVTVTLGAPFSDLLVGLAMPWASIVCPAGLADPEALATTPQGTGPYVLDAEASLRGSSMVLQARDDYAWGPEGRGMDDADRPETLVVRVIGSHTTAANELLAGSLDLAFVIGQDAERVDAAGQLERRDAVPFNNQFLLFQHADGAATADIRVRRALSMAVERDLAMLAATAGAGAVASSYITPLVSCYDETSESQMPIPDVDAARTLLAEAGYGPDNPLAIRLIGLPALQGSAPEYLLESWRQIGVEVDLSNLTLQESPPALASGEWEVVLFPLGAPMPSANTVSAYVTGDGPPNFGNVSNAAFEAAQQAAMVAAPDAPERCENWAAAQQALIDQANILPLFAFTTSFFSRPGIRYDVAGPFVLDLGSIRVAE
ncbi:ABC transporter substrate-binding protein [Pararhodobacter sp.]|uniref:ABC transporter substrate-binding protein n=1 Tax=Pararhodobacter sp. TaxID=2127056 RepID=UPI002AFEF84E|nr:ABC transporter substrate-binding protein [Pararhodobacter sp.]